MQKPENMTHLNGSELVPKTDPRISLRGKLDTLQAETLLLQVEACGQGDEALAAELQELFALLQTMIMADVTGEPVDCERLFGMTLEELHTQSHRLYRQGRKPHPLYTMGRVPALLNLMRARVREAELAAAHAAICGGNDSVQVALNRLSSALYVLYHRELHKLADVRGLE